MQVSGCKRKIDQTNANMISPGVSSVENSTDSAYKRQRSADMLEQMSQFWANTNWNKLVWKSQNWKKGPTQGKERWALCIDDDGKTSPRLKINAGQKIARFITPWHKHKFAVECNKCADTGKERSNDLVVTDNLDFTDKWVRRLVQHWKEAPPMELKHGDVLNTSTHATKDAPRHDTHDRVLLEKHEPTIDYAAQPSQDVFTSHYHKSWNVGNVRVNCYTDFRDANNKASALCIYSRNHIYHNSEQTCGETLHKVEYFGRIHSFGGNLNAAHPIDFPVMNTQGRVWKPHLPRRELLPADDWPSTTDVDLESMGRDVAHTFVVYMTIDNTMFAGRRYHLQFRRISSFVKAPASERRGDDSRPWLRLLMAPLTTRSSIETAVGAKEIKQVSASFEFKSPVAVITTETPLTTLQAYRCKFWSTSSFISLVASMSCITDLLALRLLSKQCAHAADKHIGFQLKQSRRFISDLIPEHELLSSLGAIFSGSGPFHILSNGASWRKRSWSPNDVDIFVPCEGNAQHLQCLVPFYDEYRRQQAVKAFASFGLNPATSASQNFDFTHPDGLPRIIDMVSDGYDGSSKARFNTIHCPCECPCKFCQELHHYECSRHPMTSEAKSCTLEQASHCDKASYGNEYLTCDQHRDILHGINPEWSNVKVDRALQDHIDMLKASCTCDKSCGSCVQMDSYESIGGKSRGKIGQMNIICVRRKYNEPFWKTVTSSFHHTIIQNAYDFATKTWHMNYPEHVRTGESHYDELPHERGLVNICKYQQRDVTMIPPEFNSMRIVLSKLNQHTNKLE